MSEASTRAHCARGGGGCATKLGSSTSPSFRGPAGCLLLLC